MVGGRGLTPVAQVSGHGDNLLIMLVEDPSTGGPNPPLGRWVHPRSFIHRCRCRSSTGVLGKIGGQNHPKMGVRTKM